MIRIKFDDDIVLKIEYNKVTLIEDDESVFAREIKEIKDEAEFVESINEIKNCHSIFKYDCILIDFSKENYIELLFNLINGFNHIYRFKDMNIIHEI